jgi:hypothetical protein
MSLIFASRLPYKIRLASSWVIGSPLEAGSIGCDCVTRSASDSIIVRDSFSFERQG